MTLWVNITDLKGASLAAAVAGKGTVGYLYNQFYIFGSGFGPTIAIRSQARQDRVWFGNAVWIKRDGLLLTIDVLITKVSFVKTPLSVMRSYRLAVQSFWCSRSSSSTGNTCAVIPLQLSY